MPRYRLTWAPEGRTIAIVDATDEAHARRMIPSPYNKHRAEVRCSLVQYRGAIWARKGKLLAGGVKSVASSWFPTRKEAEAWLAAMREGQEHDIDVAEVEER